MKHQIPGNYSIKEEINRVLSKRNYKYFKSSTMVSFPGSIAFDEYGKPFIILRDQEHQNRLTGNDAIKVSF